MNYKTFFMNFQSMDVCPACRSDQKEMIGPIGGENYYFDNYYIIPYKDSIGPIIIYKCCSCGLYYKNYIPTRNSLIDLFNSCPYTSYVSYYNYNDEIKMVNKLYRQMNISVLDIGAGNGRWLSCLSPINGRLSALDIKINSSCKDFITGEYIIDFFDSEDLTWSGHVYDLVTLYDVVEHLYDVMQSFANMRKVTSIGGYCIIETGDANNYYARLHGVNNWWYLNMLEHNIAFNLQTLIKAGESAGFEVVEFKKKRHKNKSDFSLEKMIKMCLLFSVNLIYPSGYKKSMAFLNKAHIPPIPPFSKDHLMVIFRRIW